MTGSVDPRQGDYRQLASYRRCAAGIADAWPAFADRRAERLRQGLFGPPVEKVAENIVEDLFTGVLDWPLADVNLQIGRADIVLSELGVKRLVVEVKRPGTLVWQGRLIGQALDQAVGYAARQKVGAVAVSDGHLLYAVDLVNGGRRDRLRVDLSGPLPPLELWWLSVHGIYRPVPTQVGGFPPEPAAPKRSDGETLGSGELVHPKYRLPARCFAYAASADRPATWKLPYMLVDGSPDLRRLPMALSSILGNYRGVKVSIPREAVADVLVRLGTAAAGLGRMPCQCQGTRETYVEAHQALEQLGRLADVGCCSQG